MQTSPATVLKNQVALQQKGIESSYYAQAKALDCISANIFAHSGTLCFCYRYYG
jgi:hypothetical protein